MNTVTIGRRKYSDPDILSLIGATGSLVDPRSSVITQARKLIAEYRTIGGNGRDVLERLKILASLRDLTVEPMNASTNSRERRDAVLVPAKNGKAKILYNSSRPLGRIAFSIAHETPHIFFPNSVTGARLRTLCDPVSQIANELERLCDLGASELLMPLDGFRSVVNMRFGLDSVEQAMHAFGSSYESTTYRVAIAHPGIAVAGLLCYRLSKKDEGKLNCLLHPRSEPAMRWGWFPRRF